MKLSLEQRQKPFEEGGGLQGESRDDALAALDALWLPQPKWNEVEEALGRIAAREESDNELSMKILAARLKFNQLRKGVEGGLEASPDNPEFNKLVAEIRDLLLGHEEE